VRPKKCKICKNKFTPIRPLQPTCNEYECKLAYAVEHANKAIERKKKAEKRVLKEKLEKLKPKSYYEALLQKEINEMARMIDFGQPCIATGNFGKMSGGHFHAVGSCPQIRYHLDNIHIQSFHSNHFKSGDNSRYRNGLINIYGAEYAEYVESLKGHKQLQLNIEEIKGFIKKARELKKEIDLTERSPIQRIEFRKKYNEKLGIYSLNQQ
jgi:hypothetical protein